MHFAAGRGFSLAKLGHVETLTRRPIEYLERTRAIPFALFKQRRFAPFFWAQFLGVLLA